MSRTRLLLGAALSFALLVFALSPAPGEGAPFREYPIGEEVRQNGMRLAAVWLPPVTTEGLSSSDAGDAIHLEADIHTIKGNVNGFGVGEWMPYLTVNYTLVHKETGKKIEGRMMPMVAKDGPHYGVGVDMPAKGLYSLTYEIRPPSENGFGRHSDPVTGVEPWWKPFTISWDFDYQGVTGG